MTKEVQEKVLDLCIENEVTLDDFYFIKEYVEDQLRKRATIKKEPHNVDVTVQIDGKLIQPEIADFIVDSIRDKDLIDAK